MSVFKEEKQIKRVIFNVDSNLAERLEKAKEESRKLGKKLDVDNAIDKALEKFLKKAEKKIMDEQRAARGLGIRSGLSITADALAQENAAPAEPAEASDAQEQAAPDSESHITGKTDEAF